MTGCAGVRPALAVLAAGLAVVVGLSVAGTLPASAAVIWAAAMVVSLDIGFVIRSQQLRIESQEREHAAREQQAVLEERQRIAPGGPRRRGALAQRHDAAPHRRAP